MHSFGSSNCEFKEKAGVGFRVLVEKCEQFREYIVEDNENPPFCPWLVQG